MQNLVKSIVLSAIMLVSSSAFSQVLWQKSETGMTVTEIAKLFPDAKHPEKESTFSKGGKALLEIPNYSVGSNNYKVEFVFVDEKLQMVRMQSKGLSPSVAFNSAKELLKTKYGQPMDVTVDSISKNIIWVSDGTQITLADIMGLVVITYKDVTKSDANKL